MAFKDEDNIFDQIHEKKKMFGCHVKGMRTHPICFQSMALRIYFSLGSILLFMSPLIPPGKSFRTRLFNYSNWVKRVGRLV